MDWNLKCVALNKTMETAKTAYTRLAKSNLIASNNYKCGKVTKQFVKFTDNIWWQTNNDHKETRLITNCHAQLKQTTTQMQTFRSVAHTNAMFHNGNQLVAITTSIQTNYKEETLQ